MYFTYIHTHITYVCVCIYIYIYIYTLVQHCCRSKEKLISEIFQWNPSHGCASIGQPTRIYRQQLYAHGVMVIIIKNQHRDTNSNPERG